MGSKKKQRNQFFEQERHLNASQRNQISLFILSHPSSSLLPFIVLITISTSLPFDDISSSHDNLTVGRQIE